MSGQHSLVGEGEMFMDPLVELDILVPDDVYIFVGAEVEYLHRTVKYFLQRQEIGANFVPPPLLNSMPILPWPEHMWLQLKWIHYDIRVKFWEPI